MVFWHMKTGVVIRCLFGTAPHYLLAFHRQGNYTDRYQIQEWEAKWLLKREQSFPRQGFIAVVSQGLSIFRAYRNHIPVRKIFFFPSLADVITVAMERSECHMTLLEKSTLTYFCTANSPLRGLFFISRGLLKIVTTPKRKHSFAQTPLEMKALWRCTKIIPS